MPTDRPTTYLPACLPACLPTYLPISLCAGLAACLPTATSDLHTNVLTHVHVPCVSWACVPLGAGAWAHGPAGP